MPSGNDHGIGTVLTWRRRSCLLLPSSLVLMGQAASLPAERGSTAIYTLHIALQDGFRQNGVTITVDGRTVYDKSGIATDLRISRADEVDVEGVAAKVRVGVVVSPGHVTATWDHDAQASPYLAISLEGGQLRFTASQEAFRYM